MAGPTLRKDGRRGRPLVVVLWSVPLVVEALGDVMEFAELAAFPVHGTDVAGLLRWLRPDALIVDDEVAAGSAQPYAQENDLPLLHIRLREDELRLFRSGAWIQIDDEDGVAPEAVLNVIAGALYAREGSR